MDAATLFMVLEINGRDRKEPPRLFPNVAACEAHVSQTREDLLRMPVPSSIKSYECMRWYAISK
jgi:hypothetical protein